MLCRTVARFICSPFFPAPTAGEDFGFAEQGACGPDHTRSKLPHLHQLPGKDEGLRGDTACPQDQAPTCAGRSRQARGGAGDCGCPGPCSRQDRTSSFSVLETTLEITEVWLDGPTRTDGVVSGLCRKPGLLVGLEAEGGPLACAAPNVASKRAAGSQALEGQGICVAASSSVVSCAGWQIGSLTKGTQEKQLSFPRAPKEATPRAGWGQHLSPWPVVWLSPAVRGAHLPQEPEI